MKVLIIDDSTINQKIARFHIIKDGNHEVASAMTGDDGIELAITTSPDLIVLKSNIPGYGGKGILKTLKKIKKTSSIPVIVTANDNEYHERETFLAMGANDFLRFQDQIHWVHEKLSAFCKPVTQKSSLASA